VTLAHWDEIAWAPGTYEFAAVADIGNLVVEKMEGNNVARSGMRVDAQGRTLP
jgi:subtilase family serine protease